MLVQSHDGHINKEQYANSTDIIRNQTLKYITLKNKSSENFMNFSFLQYHK